MKQYYLIVTPRDECTKVLADDLIHAIKRYASLCEMIISFTDFERIACDKDAETIIRMFNKLCDNQDRISYVYTIQHTLFSEYTEVAE